MEVFRSRGVMPYNYSEINRPAPAMHDKPSFWSKLTNPGRDALLRIGAWSIFTVLLLNVALFIYSGVGPKQPGAATLQGFAAIFYGTCTQAENTRLALDLVVNVLSTMLLSTSTVAMQILSAPTRSEVDQAHSKGKWLDIGVLSSRNLRSAPQIRTWIWVMLMISSFPLHLLYNSVIFTSTGANDLLAVLVTKDVANGTLSPWTDAEKKTMANTAALGGQPSSLICRTQDFHLENTTFCGEIPRPADIMVALDGMEMSLKQNELVEMDAKACREQFATVSLQGYSAVLLVTNLSSSSANDSSFVDFQWTSAIQTPNWTAHDLNVPFGNSTTYLRGTDLNLSRPSPESFAGKPFVVDHCLAQTAPTLCSVQVAQQLLTAVIVANAVKLIAIVIMIMFLKFDPLVTIGDAVVDFMNNPDPFTAGAGPISSADVRKRTNQPKRKERVAKTSQHDTAWHNKRHLWFTAGSARRWLTVTLLIFLMIATALYFLIDGTNSSQHGFGNASPADTFLRYNPTWIAVLTANAPQVVISTAYILYNGLVTCMLASAEFMDFARERKAMRVSTNERGQQRSSYFLQIPYRFALPIMGLMALLHWAVGQSLFLVHIDTYDVAQNVSQAGMISTVGYSHNGAIVATALGLVIFTVPFVLGCRRFAAGIPLVGNCSLAISAACHPPANEPVDSAERQLMYGVLSEVGAQGRRRVGFSAGEVGHLAEGEVYEQARCVRGLLRPGQLLECCEGSGRELEVWEDIRVENAPKR